MVTHHFSNLSQGIHDNQSSATVLLDKLFQLFIQTTTKRLSIGGKVERACSLHSEHSEHPALQTALVIFYSKIKGGSQVDFFAPQILLGTDMVDADIVALRENYAMRASELEEMYREREQENARAVIAAWGERACVRRDAVCLYGDLDQVRDRPRSQT